MNDSQINIAIAEACALVVFATTRPTDLPDYANDLNAMHEAEKLLNDVSYDSYWSNLVFVCIQSNMERLNSATARQRAEAFLKTIGKWEEVQP